MTDFSPLESALYQSTPEKIAASLRYLRKADAVMAALMPLSASTQAPPAAVPAEYVPLAAAQALALEAMRVGNIGGHERTVEGHWSAEVGDRFEEFMFDEGFAMLAAANKENTSER